MTAFLPSGRRRRWSRWGFIGAGAAGATVILLYATSLILASRPAVEMRLRARIAAALRARLGDVSIGDRVHVDALLRASFGPVVVPPARDGASPVLRIERVRVRPALGALLLGRVEPAATELSGVRLAPGPGARDLEHLLSRRPAHAPTAPAGEDASAASSSPLRIRDLVVEVPVGSRLVEIGPLDADASAELGAETTRIAVQLRLPGGGRVDVVAERSPAGWHSRLRARDVRPEAIPPPLRSGTTRIDAGAVSADVEGDAQTDLSRGSLRLRVAAERVVLAGERIGPDAAGPLSASAEGTVSWAREGRRLALSDAAAVVLGTLRVSAAGEAGLGPGGLLSLALRADGIDARALVAALPPSLAPPPAAPRPPPGTFDAQLDVAGPLRDPTAWTISASLDLSRMRDAARRAPPVPLRGEIVHRPEGAGAPVVVGPRNPDFVPISELPEHVVRAVTTSEDAGFFGHEGFDFEELRNALVEDAEAGHRMRGGSTITQQLAKNLFLSPERTVARKVSEAAITIALEASLPKRRILELYLNVAEWGPGVWGIGPAARHWFGKDARDLTPREAAFLASVIPNPVRYHFMFSRGAPTEAWDQRVNELLLKMLDQGVISDDQLVEALYEPIVFAKG